MDGETDEATSRLPTRQRGHGSRSGDAHERRTLGFERARLRTTLETITLVIGPTTLLAASLFYFGWILTNARMLYFGIDTSILGFSAQDFILRSVDVFFPLAASLFFAIALVAGHRKLSYWSQSGRRTQLLRTLIWVMVP